MAVPFHEDTRPVHHDLGDGWICQEWPEIRHELEDVEQRDSRHGLRSRPVCDPLRLLRPFRLGNRLSGLRILLVPCVELDVMLGDGFHHRHQDVIEIVRLLQVLGVRKEQPVVLLRPVRDPSDAALGWLFSSLNRGHFTLPLSAHW